VTECNGCGSCCDPVVVSYTKIDAQTSPDMDPADRAWVLNDLTPMPRRQVVEREPWLLDGSPRLSMAQDGGELFVPYFYSCRWFDGDTRQCTNHDGRPPACRGYPWRDHAPQPHAALPPTCSFRADVGQPVEPPRRKPKEPLAPDVH
jgi:Fe-S-cluster containining protein